MTVFNRVLMVLFLACTILHVPSYASDKAPAPANQQQQTQSQEQPKDLININTADAKALERLPRVGPKTAAKIVAHRESVGSFASKEELMNVKGIGQKTFEGLKHLITI